jgi:hypothetical protein
MRTKLVVYPALAMAAVLCGSTAMAQASVTASPSASRSFNTATPQITLSLDAATYSPGATATLRVSEHIQGARTFTVRDSSGAVWTKQSDNGTTVVYTATTTANDGVVSVKMTRTRDAATANSSVSYTVNPTPQVTLALDGATYRPNETATLQVSENIVAARTFAVTDSSGAVWTQRSDDGTTVTFNTTAGTRNGVVSVTMTRTRDLATATGSASYTVGQSQALWPGQQPGKVILGMSCGSVCPQKEADLGQAYGVHRQFKAWGDWSGVARVIQGDQAAGRLPWVSVKSPGSNATGWSAVANGDYDAAIRALATTLKANDNQPIILTFHHEPSNDGTEAEGVLWANAYIHFHDVLKAEGALVNVSDVPIVGDWLFNPQNRSQDPANWVTNGVLQRAPFLGIDLYQNNQGDSFAQRIPLIRNWMAARGFPDTMVGIGEFGSTDAASFAKGSVQWMNESLAWATAHPEAIGVASYFNSTANPMPNCYWPLDESGAKMSAYRGWMNNSVTSP